MDAAARIGGDEFALLVVETTAAAAQAVAERIELAARALSDAVPLSVSIGMAHISAATDTTSPETLVGEADARLYEIKQARHRRTIATPCLTDTVEHDLARVTDDQLVRRSFDG